MQDLSPQVKSFLWGIVLYSIRNENDLEVINMNGIGFDEMKEVDVRTVDRATLKDINDVVVDTALPKEERLRSFIEQIGNPYCYKCGDLVVKVSFAENTSATLEDRLEYYLATI